jgi:hypothetical protein
MEDEANIVDCKKFLRNGGTFDTFSRHLLNQ